MEILSEALNPPNETYTATLRYGRGMTGGANDMAYVDLLQTLPGE